MSEELVNLIWPTTGLIEINKSGQLYVRVRDQAEDKRVQINRQCTHSWCHCLSLSLSHHCPCGHKKLSTRPMNHSTENWLCRFSKGQGCQGFVQTWPRVAMWPGLGWATWTGKWCPWQWPLKKLVQNCLSLCPLFLSVIEPGWALTRPIIH